MVDSSEIFHPLRWTPPDAYRLLTDLPRLEAAGVIVRMPGVWRANRPPRPQVSAIVGGKPPSGLGTDALLDFHMEVTLDGERLTAAEIERLLAASDGLHLLRGRWIEVDRAKLGRMLEEFRAVEKLANENGLGFAEAMRLLAGTKLSGDALLDAAAPDWSRVDHNGAASRVGVRAIARGDGGAYRARIGSGTPARTARQRESG